MIGPLGLFFTAIRQHGCTPSLPAGVMIFPEDVPKQDEALPRALSDRVMAQLEHPDNLARWNNLGGHRRARHPPRPGQRRCQPARLTAVRTPMRQIPDMIGPLPDQPCVHPDRGYDSTPTRDLLDELGYIHEIARKPIPAPIQAGKRWVVERTHSLDERLRQDPPLHRETPQHRRVLPAPRRHPHRNPPPHQRSPHPLPLAGPTHHPPTEVTINCRTF